MVFVFLREDGSNLLREDGSFLLREYQVLKTKVLRKENLVWEQVEEGLVHEQAGSDVIWLVSNEWDIWEHRIYDVVWEQPKAPEPESFVFERIEENFVHLRKARREK